MVFCATWNKHTLRKHVSTMAFCSVSCCCYRTPPQAATPCCRHCCHCLIRGSSGGAGVAACGGGSGSSSRDGSSGGGNGGGSGSVSGAILFLIVVVIFLLFTRPLLVGIVLPLFVARCSFRRPPLTCLQRTMVGCCLLLSAALFVIVRCSAIIDYCVAGRWPPAHLVATLTVPPLRKLLLSRHSPFGIAVFHAAADNAPHGNMVTMAPSPLVRNHVK
jgi:hypothetical protein